MNKEIIKNYRETDEYKYFVEECRATIDTGVWEARTRLIVAYGQLGKLITENPLYKKYKKGNKNFMANLAMDTRISYSTLSRAIQFYEKYRIDSHSAKGWDKLPEGKNISWHKICSDLLPEPKVNAPPLPEGKWQVLYIDPPWAYDIDLSEGATRSPENNYPVMDLEELKTFSEKIKKISHTDCTLFMWITAPKLNWMNDVLESWGFDYKTNLIWDKIKPNMGHYSSVRHEILIIAGKGKCAPTCDGETIQSVDSVQSIEKSARHSEKPSEFMDIIDKLYPDFEKIELFSRFQGKRPKWTFWGNEI